ncbi:DNA-protecting protein DprA [Acetobacteraceae bacterium H6797]|nr:DNA-protecting protein DprA [Acetobacteraceae bacterium H6797]
MTFSESLARLRLLRTEGVGNQTWQRLMHHFGSAEAALASWARIAARGGVAEKPCEAEKAEREMEALHRLGGRFLFIGDADYPELLAESPDAPAGFALLGDPRLLRSRQVGMVGARNASAAGRRVAEEISEGLCRAGITITSGLARGIDAAAHQAAIRAGRTVAVIPGGLDRPYPLEHRALQQAIAEGGAVLAEAPLGTAPIARHFPKRNRIIAGLSLGVVVVEAAEKSGTLITARMALEANRAIYAVPGSPLDPRCRGSNNLLRQGAYLTETAADILDNLPEGPSNAPLFRPASRAVQALPPAPAANTRPPSELLDLIGANPVVVDEVLRRCHLSPAMLQASLADLELQGLVESLPGNRVVRRGL